MQAVQAFCGRVGTEADEFQTQYIASVSSRIVDDLTSEQVSTITTDDTQVVELREFLASTLDDLPAKGTPAFARFGQHVVQLVQELVDPPPEVVASVADPQPTSSSATASVAAASSSSSSSAVSLACVPGPPAPSSSTCAVSSTSSLDDAVQDLNLDQQRSYLLELFPGASSEVNRALKQTQGLDFEAALELVLQFVRYAPDVNEYPALDTAAAQAPKKSTFSRRRRKRGGKSQRKSKKGAGQDEEVSAAGRVL